MERRHDILAEAPLLSRPREKHVPISSSHLAEDTRDTKAGVKVGKRSKAEPEEEEEEVCCLGTLSSLLLSSWQTSYLTQLITHLITVSA